MMIDQSLSNVKELVDDLGTTVILLNNTPRYLVTDFSKVV